MCWEWMSINYKIFCIALRLFYRGCTGWTFFLSEALWLIWELQVDFRSSALPGVLLYPLWIVCLFFTSKRCSWRRSKFGLRFPMNSNRGLSMTGTLSLARNRSGHFVGWARYDHDQDRDLGHRIEMRPKRDRYMAYCFEARPMHWVSKPRWGWDIGPEVQVDTFRLSRDLAQTR